MFPATFSQKRTTSNNHPPFWVNNSPGPVRTKVYTYLMVWSYTTYAMSLYNNDYSTHNNGFDMLWINRKSTINSAMRTFPGN